MIYFIILIAAVIASMTGIGGGIIIRPILSTTGQSVMLVNYYASVAILSATIYSIIQALIKREAIDLKVVSFLSIGSVLGGMLGNSLLKGILSVFSDDIVLAIQSVILIAVLIFILYTTITEFEIKRAFTSRTLFVVIGLVIGMISIFIGIGGGILNVLILSVIFKMDRKDLIVNSLAMIFVSQVTSISVMVYDGIGERVDSTMLLYVILASLLGGIIGREVNTKVTSNTTKRLFIVVLTCVIIFNVYLIVDTIF